MNTQPNKTELEALAFRISKEIGILQDRQRSVEQLIAQMENSDLIASLQRGQVPGNPTQMQGVTDVPADAPVPVDPESIHAESATESVDTATE